MAGCGLWHLAAGILFTSGTTYFIFDNHARRSFVRADINTVITVTGAPRTVKEPIVYAL